MALFGLVFAIFALVVLSAAFVVPWHAPWARMGVRVARSWIASGLLVVGWAMRGY